ncbi:DUF6615 family protein [Neobacillus rhizosphaerae]|uniref:DUF6615 family protein n=1 Tax=Neobacillus rhizosphaerae TaxID=2880965 RepID=UPI003D273EC6
MHIPTTEITALFKNITVNTIYRALYRSPSTSEPSITDYIILELRDNRNENLFVIPGHNEPKKGADLEWWILYQGEKGEEMQAIHLRIQAKKQDPPGKRTPAKYTDINHYNEDGFQIDLLISAAKDEKAIPLYCFYNRYFEGKTQKDIEDKAWKYAHAEDIDSTRDVNRKINDDYKTLDEFADPMHDLASIAEKEPKRIINEFLDRNPGFKDIDYRHNQLPAYVLDQIVTDELTSHPFMKKNEWFVDKVTERILKNRKRDSDTFYVSVFGIGETIKFLGKIMNRFIKWLKEKMGFGVKNLPIIITVSKEPIFEKNNKV